MRTLSPVAFISLLGGLAFFAGCSANAPTNAPIPQPLGQQSVAQHAVAQAPFELHFPAAAFGAHPGADLGGVIPDANSRKLVESISSAGGTLKVPPFAKFGGSIGYTSNNAPSGTTITLISSVQNLAHVPNPPSGTAIFYIQATLSSSQFTIVFNSGNASATIASKKLVAAKTYTVYAYALGQLVGQFNAGHPKNGKLHFTSPINGQTIPTGVTVTVQLAQN
ncbi:MAG: hypothetical protein ABI346_00665 [Candidatus Baltobacteraceae bacterium]